MHTRILNIFLPMIYFIPRISTVCRIWLWTLCCSLFVVGYTLHWEATHMAIALFYTYFSARVWTIWSILEKVDVGVVRGQCGSSSSRPLSPLSHGCEIYISLHLSYINIFKDPHLKSAEECFSKLEIYRIWRPFLHIAISTDWKFNYNPK